MYKLAIVPKVKRSVEYSKAFGSQHDFNHITYCMNLVSINIDMQYNSSTLANLHAETRNK